MQLTRIVSVAVLATGLIPASAALVAQGTIPDYQRAAGLRQKYDGLVVNSVQTVRWIERSNRFWYRKSVRGGSEFMLVDATAASKAPAFDHAKLAGTLATMLKRPITPVTLPFAAFAFINNGRGIEFN